MGHCLQGASFCCGRAPKAQGRNRKWVSGCNHTGSNQPLIPFKPLPTPCSLLQSIQDSTLPILQPVTSPSLLLTFAGLGSGADALPGARPSFLFSPQDISLLGIWVTPSRGKVTIRFSLNSWLAHSPAPAATQERWLDVLSAGAKPKPQPH